MKKASWLLVLLFGGILGSARGVSLSDCLNAPNLNWSTGGQSPWFAQSVLSHDGVDAAQSGPIIDNQESWVETQLTGPGILTFWWKVSSEDSFDLLEFSLNSELQTGISGDSGWQQGFFAIPAGNYAARWRYVKDSSNSDGLDAGWLDQVSFQPTFSLGVGINMPALQTSSGGDAAFFGETNTTHDGVGAVQSGRITDNQISSFETTVNGPAHLAFWWKVSSEEGFDWLSFYVNGVLKKQISGELDWMQETYDLPAGSQMLSWQYSKDSSSSAGQDAAWIDQVSFSGWSPLPGFGLSASPQSGSSIHLQLTGAVTGTRYRIQTSSNLVDWLPWVQVTATNNQMVVVDTTAGSAPVRYYRAISP